MRVSDNQYVGGVNHGRRLLNGYDYDNQAWVVDGKYIRCGHPDSMSCGCYGRLHAGEDTRPSTKN